MKKTLPFWSLVLLVCAANANAQLYKWVGPDGKVTYTDTPPPPSARQVQTKAVTSGEVNTAGLPYELSQAVKTSPVTLYTTKDCAACEDGRNLLNTRGIPFTEKTVNSNEDVAEFKKVSSDNQLPVLLVGRSKERGFESSAWNTALTAAGYPESSRLPRTYRNPPPQAAAPAKQAAPAAAATRDNQTARSASPPAPTELPPAIGNAPPGFRF